MQATACVVASAVASACVEFLGTGIEVSGEVAWVGKAM